MGRIVGRLLLTLVFFLFLTPIALIRRALGGNPLRHAPGKLGYWQPRTSTRGRAHDMRRP